MLNRDTVGKAAQSKTQAVDIPEWGDSITIRQLSGKELLRLISAAKHQTDDEKKGMIDSVIASAANEDGTPMFTEADIAEVESYSASGLLRLSAAINKFNGIGEDVEKNS